MLIKVNDAFIYAWWTRWTVWTKWTVGVPAGCRDGAGCEMPGAGILIIGSLVMESARSSFTLYFVLTIIIIYQYLLSIVSND